MKRIFKIYLLGLLLVLGITARASAGGWAAITLEEWPAQIVAGTPLDIRFAVRQHGVTLLPGLDPVIHLKSSGSGKALTVNATPVEGQPGFYEASITFPNDGVWEWSIEAFTMNQPMPDLQVSEGGLAPSAEPPRTSPLPFTTGIIGLTIALLGVAFTVRKQVRWSLALVILGLVIGGAGFVSAATRQNPDSNARVDGASPATSLVSGEALFVAKGCLTCHVNGNIDQKYYDFTSDLGPNLTHYSSSPEYLRLWLKDPASVKKNTQMPNLDLDAGEIEALIEFINGKSGTDVPTLPPNPAPEKVVTATVVAQKPVGNETACSASDIRQGLVVEYSRDDGSFLALVDPASGQPLCKAEKFPAGSYPQFTTSTDRLSLAVLSAETPDQKNWRLYWIDLPSWKETDTGVVLSSWSQGMAIHPDHNRVALAVSRLTQEAEPRMIGYSLDQVDVTTKAHTVVELDIAPRLLEYTRDGRFILAYGIQYDYTQGTTISSAKIELFNVSDLSLAWEKELGEVREGINHVGEGNNPDQYTQWEPGLALSPDQKVLYIVHADADRLTMVDLSSREIHTVDIRPQLSWLERLISLTASPAQAKGLNGTIKQAILSPDGAFLYVTGNTGIVTKNKANDWKFDTLPFGLQVIQTVDGKEVGRIKSEASELGLSADGRLLFLRGWTGEVPWTDVLEAKSLEIRTHLDRQHLFVTKTLAGDEVVLGSSEGLWTQRMKVLERSQFKEVASLEGNGYWLTVP